MSNVAMPRGVLRMNVIAEASFDDVRPREELLGSLQHLLERCAGNLSSGVLADEGGQFIELLDGKLAQSGE